MAEAGTAFPNAAFPGNFRIVKPSTGHAMDATIAALAKAAGLEKALAHFPDDIEAAAAQAMGHADAVKFPVDPAVEPWPPMRAEPNL